MRADGRWVGRCSIHAAVRGLFPSRRRVEKYCEGKSLQATKRELVCLGEERGEDGEFGTFPLNGVRTPSFALPTCRTGARPEKEGKSTR